MPNPSKERVRKCIEDSMARAYLPKRLIKSIVMLSGGLDSVALLVNLLEFTTHEVHAHHIEIRNVENRAEAENAALEKALSYIRAHYRPFSYTTSKYELMLGLGGGLDMTLALFMSARVDTSIGGNTDLVWTGHFSGTTAYEIGEATAVFAGCYSSKRYKPVWITPYRMSNKVDVYLSIPDELMSMAWSCRTPIPEGNIYKACGVCHACITREDTIAKIVKLKNSETG